MPTQKTSINSAEEFQLLTDRRSALESLIKIAAGVHNQQDALSELALAARPSQDFPKKVVRYFKSIKERLENEAVPNIIKKLDAIDLITEKTLSQILSFANMDVNLLRDDEIDNISVENFTNIIDDFKRRTQTSLALRYVLQQRGVVIAPFKLPISQEAVYDQLESLKQKENDCIEQIKTEINIIIDDTNLMLKNDSLSDEMKADLVNINQGMLVNLKHLNNGGLVTEIPNVFDIITLESAPVYVANDDIKEENVVDEPNTENKSVKTNNTPSTKSTSASQKTNQQSYQQPSFWWIIKEWLASPWSTSWKSIKQKHEKQYKK